MMIEVQRNRKAIKKMEQKEKVVIINPHCLKLLEGGLTRDDVENVCNVYLEHHPIRMGIQSGPNTMDHALATSSNHNLGLIW
jgi:hypothetical protein